MSAVDRAFGPRANAWARIGLALIAATVVAGFVQSAMLSGKTPLLIRGDGIGYYAYLRSSFFDCDLDFRNEYEQFKKLMEAAGLDAATNHYLKFPPTATGAVFNPWPPGPALLWLPFFLAAHAWAVAMGAGADGYSAPYQQACALGTALYGFAGLLLTWRICCRFAAPGLAALAVGAVWLASPLVAYQVFVPWMPHALGFFSTALFLELFLAVRRLPTPGGWAMLGLAAGLCFLQRYQDALVALLPAAEWLRGLAGGVGNRQTELRATLGRALLFAAGFLAAAVPQFAAWRAIYGSALAFPHAEIGLAFDWRHLHFAQTLFAPATGLFSWSPVLLPGTAGLFLVAAKDAALGWGLLGILAAEIALVSAMPPHFQGSTFGARYFVSFGSAFALGLAAFIARAPKRELRIAIAVVLALLVCWNGLLLAQWGLGMYDRRGFEVGWNRVFANLEVLSHRLLQSLR